MPLYKQEIMLHSQQPEHYGTLNSMDVLRAHSANASCGDTLSIEVQLLAGGSIKDIAWQGDGCIISRATASSMSSFILGKKLKDIQKLSEKQWLSALQWPISPARIQCATLLLQALQDISYDSNIPNNN